MPHPDVRMKGFASRSTVEAALAWIDGQLPRISSLPNESVSLLEANDRVLAEDVTSPVNVPGFSRAMMDGFALLAAETHGANVYNPLTLEVIGASMPGLGYPGRLQRGQAVRIMTGAPMPEGADAVLPVEHSVLQGNGEPGESLLATGELSIGKHVGQVGEDVEAGKLLLRAGRALRPQDLGVLSSIGRQQIKVIRRPNVRILITGSEILPWGTSPAGNQITDSNGPMLHALATRDGGQVIQLDYVADKPEALLKEMKKPADIVLVSGGTSVGQDDHAPRLLDAHGTLAIHGVAMRPSSPTGMGRMGEAWVFLLPGNPVSCLCAYDFFAGRTLRVLAGRSREWPYWSRIFKLSRKLVSTVGRVDYARVILSGEFAEPLAISGASLLSSTTQADGFVIIPADSEGYAAGAEVQVLLY